MAGALTSASGAPASMPVGRRTPRGRRRWYLVHAPKREQATCDKVRKLVSSELLEDAFVMRKERWRKRAGEWTCYPVDMYQDYFFVVTKDASELERELSKLSFPVRIAKGENGYFAPLSIDAQAWYERMMDGSHTIRTSTGVIVDGELQLQDGPLFGQEPRIVKVVRPKRFCTVAVGDGASGFKECVPLVIPFKG